MEILKSIVKVSNKSDLSLEQLFYLACKANNVTFSASIPDLKVLMDKEYISQDYKVLKNPFLPSTPVVYEPIDVQVSGYMRIALEKLVPLFIDSAYMKTEYIEKTARKYCKGDIQMAKYLLLFQSFFPVSTRYNHKWNKHFGFSFNKGSRQDFSHTVITKFTAIYKRKKYDGEAFDFGHFIYGTYLYVKSETDRETETSYVLKPNKYLSSKWEEFYELSKERQVIRTSKKVESKEQLPDVPQETSSLTIQRDEDGL